MSITQLARKIARDLRRNPTPAESLLWEKLRDKEFNNLRFLRQYPVFYRYNDKKNFFIADFYCHELRLVIEVDGSIHQKKIEYDGVRSEILGIKDLSVIRFKNKEILSDVDKVLLNLKLEIDKLKR
jgi:very-short-patch-repair endonuclease